MSKPQAKAQKPVPSNPKVAGTNDNNQETQTALLQGGQHLALVAEFQAKQLGIAYPVGRVQWRFDPSKDGDNPQVVLPSASDKYDAQSEASALAWVAIPLCAWDAGMIKRLDCEINYRVQTALYEIQAQLLNADESLTRQQRIEAKRGIRQAIGFEPTAEMLKAAGTDETALENAFMQCEAHRATVAHKAFDRYGKNPYGQMKRAKPDPAQLSITPTYECPKGCYKDNKVFEGQRLPNVRNVSFVNARTGKFSAAGIKAVAKSNLLKCQHCGEQCEFQSRAGTGTQATIEQAKAKFEGLQNKINGIKPPPKNLSPKKRAAFNAQQAVKMQQAEYFKLK